MRLSVPFNLDATLCCGQVFLWQKRGDWWYGVIENRVAKVKQTNTQLEFQGFDAAAITRYFSLDHDLHKIKREIGKDEYVNSALQEYWGLRIIRQKPWDCLISFICATYKSIPAIRQMLLKLSAKFGNPLTFEGLLFFAFPSAEQLAKSSLPELESCGLGYRAKYVLETAKLVHEGGHDFEKVKRLPYTEAKKALSIFPGVGLKVADCVLLFSLGMLEAFPVDVRVKRVLLHSYGRNFPAGFVERLLQQGSLSDSDYKRLNDFGRTYFGKFAGYAQQYLYHYSRSAQTAKLKKPSPANRAAGCRA